MKSLIMIIVAGALINNVVLNQFLGICSFLGVSRQMKASASLGAAVIFTTHIVINISMTIRAAPIVGLPLPFVSYGGSFMLGTMLLAGLVQSVAIHRRRPHLTFATETDDPETEND